IDGLPDFIGGLLKDNGVEVITGYGKLTAAHSVQVGDQTYTADKIVIATGLHSHRLAIPGSELAHDSEDFLNLTSLPARMTVIGGGYIALELATIANAAGSDVTILLRGQQALRQFHQPFVETVLSDLTDRGVQILRDTQVTALKQADDALQVVTDTQGTLETDWVLDATGRDPNTQNLGLEDVGVAYTDHGITVNDHLQTSVPNIYASGDVIDKEQPKLTPTAIFESMYLSQTFAGETTEPIDYPAIPTVVFTTPRLAQVGLSLAQAQK
ncbi:FAD-dependent oxidoreductase, partial [Levilactobacillus brevis]|nr:FAD-dependent oxidoreductase [Levilactobacillus brevis]